MAQDLANHGLEPPFEPTEGARREYILRRVRGAPVPPPCALDRGEKPYDLIASWILSSSVPWGRELLVDLRSLLQEELSDARRGVADATKCWELGGLLALAARVRDGECGRIVSSFVAGSGSEPLSPDFVAMQGTDCLYEDFASLMFRVIDMTSPPNDVALFEAGIPLVSTARHAAALLTYLARRDPSRAEKAALEVAKRCHVEQDQNALTHTIRVLREACWGREDGRTLLQLRDLFISEYRELREFVASAVLTTFPSYLGKLRALELREAACSSPAVERVGSGACVWLRLAAG